jgi:hypothetical protein
VASVLALGRRHPGRALVMGAVAGGAALAGARAARELAEA